ncbi:hypothetical protein [Novosphingobium sp.]|uniref:hypothetical protein n=1 Tax=Novosphingobium sp. TaxID=1874826 RepID=UPI002FE3A59A
MDEIAQAIMEFKQEGGTIRPILPMVRLQSVKDFRKVMTTAHDVALSVEALIKRNGLNPSVAVINMDCIKINFYCMAGMPTPWLTGPIQAAGWFVSMDNSSPTKISWTLEPLNQARVKTPQLLYHATLSTNLASIRASGILPQPKSRTWTKRCYPTPRSFYATSKWNAFVYIASHLKQKSVISDLPSIAGKELATWSLLAVSDLGHHQFHADAVMQGALWTAAVVPPSSLSRVVGWRAEFKRAVKWGNNVLTPL